MNKNNVWWNTEIKETKENSEPNWTNPNQIEPIRTPSNVQNTKNGDVVVIKSKFSPQSDKRK